MCYQSNFYIKRQELLDFIFGAYLVFAPTDVQIMVMHSYLSMLYLVILLPATVSYTFIIFSYGPQGLEAIPAVIRQVAEVHLGRVQGKPGHVESMQAPNQNQKTQLMFCFFFFFPEPSCWDLMMLTTSVAKGYPVKLSLRRNDQFRNIQFVLFLISKLGFLDI